MKTLSILAFCLLSALTTQLSRAQGSITPPAGPPVASMKTLDQVEARTAVQSLAAAAPYTISQPGSYYLTGNITVASGDAITITSNDVSLDLNGFTIRSTFTGGGSGSAIHLTGNHSRLAVRNGFIASGTTVPSSGPAVTAGFINGIVADLYITQGHVCDVHVTGVVDTGIWIDSLGVVERCTAMDCGSTGINAGEVQNCTAENCLNKGIAADGSVTNSSGFGRNSGGVSCINATNCSGSSTGGTGLSCTNATNCTGTSSSSVGLSCIGNASNCTGTSTSGTAALSVTGTASFCRGTRPGGVAISAAIAVACTSGGGTITGNKQLGTP